MEMTVWLVTIRPLRILVSERKEWSILVATKSSFEKDAVRLARSLYSPSWWEDSIITGVESRGTLKAAEGLNVPQEEADY